MNLQLVLLKLEDFKKWLSDYVIQIDSTYSISKQQSKQ